MVNLAHSASAQLGEDLVRTYRLANHSQILARATARPADARAARALASEGGPPTPSEPMTS